MFKTPNPRWRGPKDTKKNEPKQGSIMARSPNNPKGPPGSTKGKHHKTATRQTPKGPTSNDLTTRLFGIDFWHAVEFSRIKRTPPQTFRPAVGARFCCVSILPDPRRGPEFVPVGDRRVFGVFPAVEAEDLL